MVVVHSGGVGGGGVVTVLVIVRVVVLYCFAVLKVIQVPYNDSCDGDVASVLYQNKTGDVYEYVTPSIVNIFQKLNSISLLRTRMV